MKRFARLKWLFTGAIIGTLVASGVTALGASTAQFIEVYYNNIKVYIDGEEKTVNDQPFIYEGKTYVPLRFVSESLGKNVQWDSKNASVYIGKPPSGNVTYLENMKTFADETGVRWSNVSEFISNVGKKYIHGINVEFANTTYSRDEYYQFNKSYLLNGKYSEFEAVIDVNEIWNTKPSNQNIGVINIFVDGEQVFAIDKLSSTITEPIPIKIDLTNATEMTIKCKAGSANASYGNIKGGGFGIFEAKFIN